jgi:ABC-type antimicrobial peptide transport system permease subunit
MWTNRFGNLTALRIPLAGVTDHPVGRPATRDPIAPLRDGVAQPGLAFQTELEQALLSRLNPESIGLRFEPVRAQALAAATQSQDFGGLFIGFSFFLVLAALILMALLFQFGLENRLGEVGTLLALGFTPKQVRRLLLGEGAALALLGGFVGVVGGAGYARALLWGLTTLWRDAVGTSALEYHTRPETYLIGWIAAVLVCSVTIALVLRKQARRPARELLSEEAGAENIVAKVSIGSGRWAGFLALGTGTAALAMVAVAVWQGEPNPPLFFAGGALLLVAGLGGVGWLLAVLGRSQVAERLTITAMGVRNITRQRKRSLASVALLACGSFLIIAVGANKLDAQLRADEPASGTGGFALMGESTLPVLRDLNETEGQEFYGLDPEEMKGVSILPLRVREGDEASCLNLNRAQKPILLGVNPGLLDQRNAFTFTQTIQGRRVDHPWRLLRETTSAVLESDVVPAIGDANSIRWALGKKVGDIFDYTDARGRTFKILLVGAVANSILQGYLLIDEDAFLRRFPDESGFRLFLINAPTERAESVSAALSRALQDTGLELTPTVRRLAAFNAVQNTYLNTFQILGGLGLLLGSAGLGVVVLRNVLERRGELALLQAVGFRRTTLQWLVLSEHGALLGLGLVVGAAAALLAVMPGFLRPGADLPGMTLALTLLSVLASGMVWTWLATRLALRGELLPALRNE